jgi:hypothetical protein
LLCRDIKAQIFAACGRCQRCALLLLLPPPPWLPGATFAMSETRAVALLPPWTAKTTLPQNT